MIVFDRILPDRLIDILTGVLRCVKRMLRVVGFSSFAPFTDPGGVLLCASWHWTMVAYSLSPSASCPTMGFFLRCRAKVPAAGWPFDVRLYLTPGDED